MSEAKRQLTINEVIAFNLARARRRRGWTQDETAEKLTAVMGKKWTKGTLGPAERSWETDRVREFNGDELAAFCLVFEQPLGYFLLPPDTDEVADEFRAGPEGAAIGRLDWLAKILPLGDTHEFVDLANVATRRHNISWAPSWPTWYRREELSEVELEDEAQRKHEQADEMPAVAEVVDEAKRRRIRELLREVDRLLAPEDHPRF